MNVLMSSLEPRGKDGRNEVTGSSSGQKAVNRRRYSKRVETHGKTAQVKSMPSAVKQTSLMFSTFGYKMSSLRLVPELGKAVLRNAEEWWDWSVCSASCDGGTKRSNLSPDGNR